MVNKAASRGTCHFKDEWINQDLYPEFASWVIKQNELQARCRFCRNGTAIIDLKVLGKSALTSHMKSQTHRTLSSLTKKPVSAFFKSPTNSTSCDTNNNKTLSGNCNDEKNLDRRDSISNVSIASSSSTVDIFCLNKDVYRAEILFAFCQVDKHASLRCFSQLAECLPIMFHDSNIAKKFKMQKDKLSYSVTYGLGPFFQENVAHEVRESDFFAASFDESLNKVAQKGQLDVVIRHWRGNDVTETNYLTSCFILDATASGLLDAFKKGFDSLRIDLKNLYQVSMDGPNVNLKFLQNLKCYLKETYGNDHLELINIGTCSLHVVNNSYKTGHNKSGWALDKYLRSSYYLFKDFPTRRGTFSRVTQSYEFPLKFCSIRWTENVKVLSRAKILIPKMRNYVNAVSPKPPKSKNFEIVKTFVSDVFIEAKLSFLISVAYDLELYLIIYQKDEPLLPFMYEDLFKMLKNLFSRIVKPEILKNVIDAENLLKIDLDNKNNLSLAIYVDLGVAATTEVNNLKNNIKKSEIIQFRMDCQTIILEICKKLCEKSPLKYKFVKGASCLSPKVMLVESKAKRRIQIALEELVASKYISSLESERVRKDYVDFLDSDNVKAKLLAYDRKKDRLDSFLLKICTAEKCSAELTKFIKIILLFFHGQADVERSFSYNKEFLVENLQEDTLIAQRSVHNFLRKQEKIIEIDITKEMIAAFKSASSGRQEALRQKREQEDLMKKRKRELSHEIQQITAQKEEAEETIAVAQKQVKACEKTLKKLKNIST